jgi:hypothetical protein
VLDGARGDVVDVSVNGDARRGERVAHDLRHVLATSRTDASWSSMCSQWTRRAHRANHPRRTRSRTSHPWVPTQGARCLPSRATSRAASRAPRT